MKLAFCAVLGLAALGPLMIAPHNAHADDIDKIAVSGGYFDAFDNDGAADFRVEYRPGTSVVWELRPWLGAEVTSDGGIYGGAGFLYDYNMNNQWYLTPSIGAGLYSDGGGKDMGSSIEFRTQLEVGYQFENSSRVSAGLSHMSNLGIDDHNPGAETLSVYYHIPMQWIQSGPGGNGY